MLISAMRVPVITLCLKRKSVHSRSETSIKKYQSREADIVSRGRNTFNRTSHPAARVWRSLAYSLIVLVIRMKSRLH